MKETEAVTYQDDLGFARGMDGGDSLRSFRDQFYIPQDHQGEPYIYFCGNSLGLQPKTVKAGIEQELKDWQNLGVEGHLQAQNPWLSYHEFLTDSMANLVGAKPREVIVMNTLSVNLHLMMVSFYRPTADRYRILIEYDAFPSDRFAVESQIKYHGYEPDDALIQLQARKGEHFIRMEDIEQVILEKGPSIALILLGNTNYYTGQYFDMKRIASAGHAQGCQVGFDCAHAVGNLDMKLHDSNIDFAVWCSYKYLNSGPGSLGGCFVHERHATNFDLPRFAGWWGHNKKTRFGMRDPFDPIPGAESWQLSNPPILSMAAVWASLKIFQEAGMENLRKKSLCLTGYLEYLLHEIQNDRISIITPADPEERGCQLSVQIANTNSAWFQQLHKSSVIVDWREPDVIRMAPAPLYNTFEEVYRFAQVLKKLLIHG